MVKKVVFLLALVCLPVAGVSAQSGGDSAGSPSGQPEFDLKIYEAPPHGLLKLFMGEEIDPQAEITADTSFEVLRKQLGYGFKGTYVWYKVQPLDEDDRRDWWIRSGPFVGDDVLDLPSVGGSVLGQDLVGSGDR